MSRKLPKLRKKAAYDDVKEIAGKSAGRDNWVNEELLAGSAITLDILSDDDMLHDCRIFLHGLHVKMTSRAIAATMKLVWNMRSTDSHEHRIFPRDDPGMDHDDKPASVYEVEGETYTSSEIDDILDGIIPFEIRRSCAFLAASTLKMFSKDVSSWMKAWDNNHFSSSYKSLTKKEFPLGTLEPKMSEVEFMYEAYQGHKIYKNTLGRILYTAVEIEDPRQTEMLFGQHLSCTGMHIIPQFLNAKMVLECSAKDLLNALDMQQNEATLFQLKDLINTSLCLPPSKDNRATWRYARIFDPSAFALLQTKFACETVAVLAHINNIAASGTTRSNSLDIAVLKMMMGPKRLKNAKIVAHNIYHYFTVTARVIKFTNKTTE